MRFVHDHHGSRYSLVLTRVFSSCPSTSQRSHRRTSIRLPTSHHQHRHPSPPPPSKQARVTSRSAWPKHTKADTDAGHYTLTRPTFDRRGREIRSEIWQPDREEEYIALYGQRIHEHVPRRPRARTIASGQDVDVRSGRPRVRSGSLSSSALDRPQLRQTCTAIAAADRTELPPTSRKRDSRRKPSMHHRPTTFVRRDSGYESDDAGDTSNEGEAHFYFHCFFSLFLVWPSGNAWTTRIVFVTR
jgi:hypothetical protein